MRIAPPMPRPACLPRRFAGSTVSWRRYSFAISKSSVASCGISWGFAIESNLTTPGHSASGSYGSASVDVLGAMRSLGPRYRALWTGQSMAQFGTYVAFFSIPALIAFITEKTNTLDYALAYALENIPIVLTGLVGGVLLDRSHLRPVIIATHLIRAAVFFYLSATASAETLEVGTILALAFVIGTMSTMFDGALYALLPNIVKKKDLPRANSLITATTQANFALAPLFAGVLTAVFARPSIGLFLSGLPCVAAPVSMHSVRRG